MVLGVHTKYEVNCILIHAKLWVIPLHACKKVNLIIIRETQFYHEGAQTEAPLKADLMRFAK